MPPSCDAKGSVTVWCGYCYANVVGRASYAGHRAYRKPAPPVSETLAMALQKRNVSPDGPAGKVMPGKMGLACPLLFEMLTVTTWPDGEARVPATLTIFVDGGGFKCCLNDKDQGLSCFYFAESLDGLFSGLEGALKGDTLVWKGNGQGPAPKKKSRKST